MTTDFFVTAGLIAFIGAAPAIVAADIAMRCTGHGGLTQLLDRHHVADAGRFVGQLLGIVYVVFMGGMILIGLAQHDWNKDAAELGAHLAYQWNHPTSLSTVCRTVQGEQVCQWEFRPTFQDK